VTATDGSAASASDAFTLTVTNANDAPTLANPIPDQNATEDSAFSFQLAANTFADVDAGDTFTYAASLADGSALPGWLSFDAATRTFSGTPANGDVGTIGVRVTATDGGGASASDAFTVTVANTNDTPTVANPIPDQSATEDVAFSFHLPSNTFSDVDAGDTLAYIATLADGSALPAWLAFDAATRTFSGTPGNADVGTVAVRVTATDGSAATASDTFNLSVANANDAPTLASPLVDQSATEDVAFSFQFPANTFGDVDAGDSLGYPLADGSALPGWLSFDAATRTFSGTPANGDVGSVAVRVTATDAGGASASDAFTITVTNANDAPAVANPIPDQAATEDAPFSFQFAADTFGDVDAGDSLVYSATRADGSALPSWLTFDPATRTFTGTPSNSEVGTVGVRVTATDGSGASTSDAFNLVVANANDGPTVSTPIPDQAATEDSPFGFQLAANTFADVDAGDTLTYAASLVDGSALPSWLSFDAATRTFSGTPANGDVGTVAVRVTATDGSGASASDAFSLSVANANDAPTLANPLADRGATEDVAFSVQFPANTFSDVDAGDTLAYAATLADGSALPAWLTFDPATRTFAGTPGNVHVGTIALRVTATDGSGATASDTFDLVVTNVNDAPTISTAGTVAYTENDAPALLDAALMVGDVDDANLEGATVSITGGFAAGEDVLAADTTGTAIVTAYDATTGVLTLSGTDTVAHYQQVLRTVAYHNTSDSPSTASRTATFTVDDGAATASDTVTITVSAVNDAPTIATAAAAAPAFVSGSTTTLSALGRTTLARRRSRTRGRPLRNPPARPTPPTRRTARTPPRASARRSRRPAATRSRSPSATARSRRRPPSRSPSARP
jgi:hypothetical protein